MATDIGRRLAAHFGPEGLRRFDPSELTGLDLPQAAGEALIGTALPVQVGPYFFATAGEPLALGEYAATIGFPDEDATSARWCRLGSDNGAEICVDPSGGVQAVFAVADAPAMLVNSTVAAFSASLLTLDQYLTVLASPGDQRPAEVFRGLRGRLLEIDGAALQDDEAWWPKVLEQIRHALSFPFSAAMGYADARGDKHIVTAQAKVGLPHPERVLWHELSGGGVRPEQVTRVYTELEPCFLPGNYCAMWLTQFKNADFTHSFDYGDTARNREDGFVALMRHAAGQQR
jgi:hypothetical protein